MIWWSALAFSYFCQSFSPFRRLAGFSMTYLIWPWTFSVHEASHVTVLSLRTYSNHCKNPQNGQASVRTISLTHCTECSPQSFTCDRTKFTDNAYTSFHRWPSGAFGMLPPLPQLITTSSGMTRRFSIPILGCSPRPRNRPGGSILKLPIFSRCPSIWQ